MGGGAVGIFDDLASFRGWAGEAAIAVHSAHWWGAGDREVHEWWADRLRERGLVWGLVGGTRWVGDIVAE